MAGTVNRLRCLALDGRPVQTANGTGIGSYTSQLIKALSRTDLEEMHLAWMPGEKPLCLGLKAHYWTLGRDNRLEQEAVPGWVEAAGAQVYHLTQNGFGWPRRLKAPLIVTLHDVIPYLLPEAVRPSYLLRYLEEVPGAIKAAARIITVSAKAREDVCHILSADPGKVTVIPSAPAAIFHQRDKAVAARFLAERYGLRGRFLLYVGGYNSRKNLQMLIWAFSRIVRFLPDRQRLVMAGARGPNTERLRQLASALGIEKELIFPGHIPRRHLPLFYAAADLFCYPSLYEGFGLPPLEAMACGTPVVASNSSSMPEVLGDAALLVPPEDTPALSQAMLHLLTDQGLAAEYRRRGMARAALYRWDDIARRTIRTYEEVL